MREGKIYTDGGPFIMLPEKCFKDWMGVAGGGFHGIDGETDYDIACDRSNDPPKYYNRPRGGGCVVLFSDVLGLHVADSEFGLLIGLTVVNDRGETFIDEFLKGKRQLKKPQNRTSIPKGFFPAALFDSAIPGPEVSEEEVIRINGDCNARYQMDEYCFTQMEIPSYVWSLRMT